MAKTAVLRPQKKKTRTRTTRRLLPVLERLDMAVVASARLNGQRASARVRNAVQGLERDLTIDGANVLSVTFLDPARDLLRADVLSHQLDINFGAAGRWRMDRSRDIGGLSVDGDTLTLRLWDILSASLRGQTSPLRVSSDRLDIGGFANVLLREVRSDVVGRLVAPYPGEVPPDEQTSSDRGGSAAGFDGSTRLKGKVDDAGRSGNLSAGELRNAAEVLEVARKEKAPARATLALVVACMVEGPDFRNSRTVTDGTSVGILQADAQKGSVEDRTNIQKMCRRFLRGPAFTGGPDGAIQLARKNPTWTAGQIAQHIQGSGYPARYDRQVAHAKTIIAAWRGGDEDGSGAASRPAQWRRGSSKARESSWSALDREAKRLGRRRFVALPWLEVPRLVVAADQQLIKAQPHLLIDGLDDSLLTEHPRIDLEGIERLQTVDLSVIASGWSAPPGGIVELANCGPADGPWIVQRLTAPAGSDQAKVTLQKPTTKVEAQQDRSTGSGRSGVASSASSSGADAVFAKGAEISRRNLPYVWGGGHSKAGQPTPGGGFDCSGYVVACLAEAGWGFKPGGGTATSGALMSWGKPGKGHELTVWANAGHVFIQGHGKHAGKWIDTGNSYTQGNRSRGPHIRTGSRNTAGFTPRHWPGH